MRATSCLVSRARKVCLRTYTTMDTYLARTDCRRRRGALSLPCDPSLSSAVSGIWRVGPDTLLILVVIGSRIPASMAKLPSCLAITRGWSCPLAGDMREQGMFKVVDVEPHGLHSLICIYAHAHVRMSMSAPRMCPEICGCFCRKRRPCTFANPGFR